MLALSGLDLLMGSLEDDGNDDGIYVYNFMGVWASKYLGEPKDIPRWCLVQSRGPPAALAWFDLVPPSVGR